MTNEDFSNLDELKVLKWIETHSALNSQAKVQNLLKRADPRSNDCKSEIFTCIRKSAVLMGINPPTVKELSSTIQERAKRNNNSSEPPAQIKELLDRQHKKIEMLGLTNKNLQSKVDVYLQQIVQMQINKNRDIGPPKTWQPKQPKRFEQPKPQPVTSATGAIIDPSRRTAQTTVWHMFWAFMFVCLICALGVLFTPRPPQPQSGCRFGPNGTATKWDQAWKKC